MTGTDWVGLIGVLIVSGSILIAALGVTAAIVQDARRALELRAAERPSVPEAAEWPSCPEDFDDLDRELAGLLLPLRGGLRVLPGGRDGGEAA